MLSCKVEKILKICGVLSVNRNESFSFRSISFSLRRIELNIRYVKGLSYIIHKDNLTVNIQNNILKIIKIRTVK